jgi:hypothetical protein
MRDLSESIAAHSERSSFLESDSCRVFKLDRQKAGIGLQACLRDTHAIQSFGKLTFAATHWPGHRLLPGVFHWCCATTRKTRAKIWLSVRAVADAMHALTPQVQSM